MNNLKPERLEQDSMATVSWRGNVLKLALVSACASSVTPAMLALGGLVGLALAPHPWLATLPITCHMIGTACSAMPAALFMHRVGRRQGLLWGCAIGLCGLAIIALGLLNKSFWQVCIGAIATGSHAAFMLQIRFAAVDVAPAVRRPEAISWVMSAGVITAVLGPQTSILGKDMFASAYSGSLLLLAFLVGIAMLVLTALRVPPAAPDDNDQGRSLAELLRQPLFMVALLSAVVCHSLMSLVMTASPLAMHHAGHSSEASSLGIQWHVLAMFLPSFVTGKLIARCGSLPIIMCGMVLIMGSAAVALMGLTLAHFWLALIMLGVGWNFGFIGATSLLAEQHTAAERGKVQGLNDLCVFGMVVLASLLSGALINFVGWDAINWLVLPALGAVCVLLVLTYRFSTAR